MQEADIQRGGIRHLAGRRYRRRYGSCSVLAGKAAPEGLVFKFGERLVVDHNFKPIMPEIELPFPQQIDQASLLRAIRIKQQTWDRRHQPCLLHLVVCLDHRDARPGWTKNRPRHDELTRHHEETRADCLVVFQCALGRDGD